MALEPGQRNSSLAWQMFLEQQLCVWPLYDHWPLRNTTLTQALVDSLNTKYSKRQLHPFCSTHYTHCPGSFIPPHTTLLSDFLQPSKKVLYLNSRSYSSGHMAGDGIQCSDIEASLPNIVRVWIIVDQNLQRCLLNLENCRKPKLWKQDCKQNQYILSGTEVALVLVICSQCVETMCTVWHL